ncbi:MAG: hypothetical protein LBV75_05450 [Paludibacter sp.]|jgi:hypothetical protein|nr:hypothetical protein [Paludibacter sp.]
MIHNFDRSLLHEREFALGADNFYRTELNATEILRYNTDSEHDMNFQHRDIDVTVTVNDRKFNVSEKFRDTDFGDLYIEVFSKYPQTMGWMHSGNPDFIAYFTPKAIYLIAHTDLKAFCLNTLFPSIPQEFFSEIFISGKTIVKKKFEINNKQTEIAVIQAHNCSGNVKWETIGIAIHFDLLTTYDVKWRKYEKIVISDK